MLLFRVADVGDQHITPVEVRADELKDFRDPVFLRDDLEDGGRDVVLIERRWQCLLRGWCCGLGELEGFVLLDFEDDVGILVPALLDEGVRAFDIGFCVDLIDRFIQDPLLEVLEHLVLALLQPQEAPELLDRELREHRRIGVIPQQLIDHDGVLALQAGDEKDVERRVDVGVQDLLPQHVRDLEPHLAGVGDDPGRGHQAHDLPDRVLVLVEVVELEADLVQLLELLPQVDVFGAPDHAEGLQGLEIGVVELLVPFPLGDVDEEVDDLPLGQRQVLDVDLDHGARLFDLFCLNYRCLIHRRQVYVIRDKVTSTFL